MTISRRMYIPVLVLVIAGGWGLAKIYHDDLSLFGFADRNQDIHPLAIEQKPSGETVGEITAVSDFPVEDFQGLENLLANNLFRQAINRLDQLYPLLSSNELEKLQKLFLGRAEQLFDAGESQSAETLLKLTAESYDDITSWNALATVAESRNNWELAYRALLRASELEYRPDHLLATLQALVKVSSRLRASLEKQGDWLAIKAMYQNLNDQHPGHARFQLELARAHLRLNEPSAATRLLELLQYDLDLGEIARQMLTDLRPEEAQKLPADDTAEPRRQPGEVVVPLMRAGDSFLVNVSFGSRRLTMLLDTGASITALSQQTIEKLRLRPTGRFIQLHTANGLRRSQLYRAGRIRLGRLSVSDFVVAEVEFDHSEKIQGLLGTDLLNQIDSRYSFVLDNQQNALIFREK